MNTPPPCPLAPPVIIIAGGQSQRLRIGKYHRKWQLPFGNGTLLQHMLDIASQLSNTVIISGSYADSHQLSQYPYPVISDEGLQGPLSGILSALIWGKENKHSTIMILPCDTPFINTGWLNHLAYRFSAFQEQVLISRSAQGVHPLCSVWSTQLSDKLSRFMLSSEKKAVYGWARQYAKILDYEGYMNGTAQAVDTFMNINTVAEYETALALQNTSPAKSIDNNNHKKNK